MLLLLPVYCMAPLMAPVLNVIAKTHVPCSHYLYAEIIEIQLEVIICSVVRLKVLN